MASINCRMRPKFRRLRSEHESGQRGDLGFIVFLRKRVCLGDGFVHQQVGEIRVELLDGRGGNLL